MANDEWKNSPLDPNAKEFVNVAQGKSIESVLTVMDPSDAPKRTQSISNFDASFVFDRQTFSSQVPVTGRFRLNVGTAEKTTLLKSITLQLEGREQIYDNPIAKQEAKGSNTSVNRSSTETANDSPVDPCKKIFVCKTITLQDENTPPCDAVKAGSKPEDNYWQVQKGASIFPFMFNIPSGLPSSWKGSKGEVTYSISVQIQLKIKGVKQILECVEQIKVYEALSLPLKFIPVMTSASKQLNFGGKGELESICTVNNPVVAAGSFVYLNLMINNHSRKKVNSVKLSLIRRVKTFAVGITLTGETEQTLINLWKKTVCETVVNPREFAVGHYKKKKDGIVNASSPREIVVELLVPSGLVSIRHTQHLEVSFVLQISIGASMNKDLISELPLQIVHPLTHQPLPQIAYNPSLFIHKEDPINAITNTTISQSPSHAVLPASPSKLSVNSLSSSPVAHRKAPPPPVISSIAEDVPSSDTISKKSIKSTKIPQKVSSSMPHLQSIDESKTQPVAIRFDLDEEPDVQTQLRNSDEGIGGSEESIDEESDSPLKKQLREKMKSLRASPVGEVKHNMSKSPSHSMKVRQAEDAAVVQDLDNILSDLSRLNQTLEV